MIETAIHILLLYQRKIALIHDDSTKVSGNARMQMELQGGIESSIFKTQQALKYFLF